MTIFRTLTLIGLCLNIQACHLFQSKSSKSSSKAQSSHNNPDQNGPGSLHVESKGELIVRDMEAELSQTELSDQQASMIADEATGSLAIGEDHRLKLSDKANPNNLKQALPAITAAAIAALGLEKLKLSDESLKLKIVKVISSAIMKSLKNKVEDISESEKNLLPSKVVGGGVSALDKAGFKDQHLNNSLSKLLTGTVNHLDTSGISHESLPQVLKKIGQAGISNLKHINTTARHIPSLAKTISQSSVKSLKNAGMKQSQVSEVLNQFIEGSISGLSSAGLTTPLLMQDSVAHILEGSVGSLGKTGVQQTKDMSDAINQSISGALSSLKSLSFDSSDIGIVVDDIMTGVVSSYEALSNDNKDLNHSDFQSLTKKASQHTIEFFDDIEVKSEQDIKIVSRSMASGIMSGYGSISNSLISTEQVQETAQVVTEAAISSLYHYIGEVEQFSDVSDGFSRGILEGLAQSGTNQDALSTYQQNVMSGYLKALEAEGLDEASIQNYQSSLESSTSQFVESVDDYCLSKNGTWNSEEQKCLFPDFSLTNNSEQFASLEEENECAKNSGVILYRTDGSWFCDQPDCTVDSFPSLLAENIKKDIKIGPVVGTANLNIVPLCSETLKTNCLTSAEFPAIDSQGLAEKIIAGKQLAGITGTNNLSATASDCTSDGQDSCLSNTSYAAANIISLAEKVIEGHTVAGVAGSAKKQSPNCSSDGETSCLSNAQYKATETSDLSTKVLQGQTVAGIAGSRIENQNYSDCTSANQIDCLTTENYKSMDLSGESNSTSLTGDSFNSLIANSSEFQFWDGAGNRFSKVGDSNLSAGNIKDQVNLFGINGTANTLPNCNSISIGGTWVSVPGDPYYGTNDFCIMKYEAKDADGEATSQDTGTPWVSITQEDANAKCEALGHGYKLISNDQWMTIAANITSQATNWTESEVGRGSLTTGHSDSNPNNSCSASTDDSLAFVDGDCSPKSSGTPNQRRTHTLSNGSVVWDLAGNVWEWTHYRNKDNKPSITLADGEDAQNAFLYHKVNGSAFMPITDLVASNLKFWNNAWISATDKGIGKFKSISNAQALFRGGDYGDDSISGIFAATFEFNPTQPDPNIGFRCVIELP